MPAVGELVQAIAEGLTLSEFNVGAYKTSDAPPPASPAWTMAMPDQAPDVLTRARAAIDRGKRWIAGGVAHSAANALPF